MQIVYERLVQKCILVQDFRALSFCSFRFFGSGINSSEEGELLITSYFFIEYPPFCECGKKQHDKET